MRIAGKLECAVLALRGGRCARHKVMATGVRFSNTSQSSSSSSSSSPSTKRRKGPRFDPIFAAAEVQRVNAEQSYETQLPSSGKASTRHVQPERKSRYIGKLVQRAQERKAEAQLIRDRKLAKSGDVPDEKFVTPAYQRVLDEQYDASQARLPTSEHSPPAPSEPPPTDQTIPEESRAEERPQESRRRKRGRLRSRFADSKQQKQDSDSHPTPKTRGLRRNTPESIERYRQRYFARRAALEKERQKDSLREL